MISFQFSRLLCTRKKIISFCISYAIVCAQSIISFYTCNKALDPARPLIAPGIGNRLDSGDAKHVQVMHTNAGYYGEGGRVGHVDFCVNGGKRQPYCSSTSSNISFHSISLDCHFKFQKKKKRNQLLHLFFFLFFFTLHSLCISRREFVQSHLVCVLFIAEHLR